VGASGVVVDMGLLALLVQIARLPPVLAKALACECAIVNNFLWNDHWTFRDVEATARRGARFLRFNGVSLAGLALNVGLFAAQVHWLGMNLYLANAIAIVVVAGFNYTLSRQWAWRTASPKEAE
jgi:dolichol-phosphate mannosyltransferase